jgi:sigma-B regulation protein RsbU (phosphoserine phosphatase)
MFYRKAVFFSVLLPLSVLFITSCAGTHDADYNMLSPDWRYSEGVDGNENPKDVVQYKFKDIDRFDNLEEKVLSNTGFIWLRNEFSLPDDFEMEEIALTLGRISVADKTYLNGNLIGSGGSFPPNFFSAWNLTRLYSVPRNIVKKERNILLVKIYVNGEGSMSGPRFMGKMEAAKAVSGYDQFIYSTMNSIIAVLVFMIGFLYFVIYLNRRVDRENLYYSLMCFLFSLMLSNLFIAGFSTCSLFPISYLSYQKIVFSLLSVTVFVGMLFIHAFLSRPLTTKALIIDISAVAVPLILYWIQPNYVQFNHIKDKALLFLAIPIFHSLFILGMGTYRKCKDIWILLLGLSPLLAANIYDLVCLQILKDPDGVFMSGYGFTAFIISMSLILSVRFSRTIGEVEELNRTLEMKVNERTSELKEANDKLGTFNVSLSEINRKLEHTQRIARMDMDMAVNIQRSLLPEHPPVLNGWDFAFEFRPMSGVSGDFYQFFTKENKLIGAGIFDVSGHGIASGLITMIANSVINRIFSESLDVPLSRVLVRINEEIIREIGNVDNYITGILLRFDGDTVEYVNAGHTELLVKRDSVGVRIIKNKNNDFKGAFLGIEGMNSDYRSLFFNVRPDDALILYTDCVLEASNPQRKSFGFERLVSSLESCGGGMSASDVVRTVMRGIEDFTEGMPLNDDCTLIVIKRK